MAKHTQPAEESEDLIAEIAANREELAARRLALHRAGNIGDRVQRSIHQHAFLFFGSAAVLGLLLSLIPSSPKSKREKRAEARDKDLHKAAKRKESGSLGAVIGGLVVKAAIDMAKPMVLKIVQDHYSHATRPQKASRPQPVMDA